jgi:hypothetical protein
LHRQVIAGGSCESVRHSVVIVVDRGRCVPFLR